VVEPSRRGRHDALNDVDALEESGGEPVIRSIAVLTAVGLLSAPPCTVAGPRGTFAGTWELDLSKSSYSPGPAPKRQTLTWEIAGSEQRVRGEGVDSAGNSTAYSFTFKYDGHDHPTEGPVGADAVSAKHIDDRTTEVILKKAGKTVETLTFVASEDGKGLSIYVSGMNKAGLAFHNINVWNRVGRRSH
jgi:hypothetical protein